VRRAPAFLLCGLLLAAAPARAATRTILVLNAGSQAIFTLRVGHEADAQWSADLLGLTEVIPVGRGRELAIDVDPAVCTYDLLASYRDGRTQEETADLCTLDTVRFGN